MCPLLPRGSISGKRFMIGLKTFWQENDKIYIFYNGSIFNSVCCTYKKLLEYKRKHEQEFPNVDFMGNSMYCEYIDSMGYEVYLAKYDDGYLKRRQINGALFGELRYYFLNGNLQQLGEYYSRDFECGIWKEYDIEGHLLKEVNKDEPYKQFSWQKVLLFTKKKDIDLNDERTYVGRYIDESNIPCWDISWHKKGEGFGRNVVIDARNGRIINETISCMEK